MAGIRVATLNIWGRHGDWPARRTVLRDGFAELAADLVALQETFAGDGDDQVAEVLGPEYEIVHRSCRTADGLGCSIASRLPIRAVHEIDLRVTERVDPGDFPGHSAAVEVETAAGPVLFVDHKPNWQVWMERERELQALAMASEVETLLSDRDLHVIVAGDMDARPDTASMRFWTGRQSLEGLSVSYQDAWEAIHPGAAGHTFTTENPLTVTEADWSRIPPRRIDYILVRCDDRGPTLRIRDCRRLFDRPVNGIWASDHYGVTADLEALSA